MSETQSLAPSASTFSSKNVGSKIKRKVRQRAAVKSFTHDEFMAAAIGDTAWLKQALKGGKDATKFDKNGLAAIHLAALHGRLDSLKFLVEFCRVDVNLPSSTGWRPLHLAINSRTGKRGIQCLQYLLDKGADPSVINDDMLTPSHQAAIEGSAKCLEALIVAGANINLPDSNGHIPLDYAKIWGHRICARLLASEGWKKDKEIQLQEKMREAYLQKLKKKEEELQREADDAEKEFFGSISFTNWLEDKGLPKKPTGPNSVSECHHKTRKLQKANSQTNPRTSESFNMKLPQMESNRTITPANQQEIRQNQAGRQTTSKHVLKGENKSKTEQKKEKTLKAQPILKITAAAERSTPDEGSEEEMSEYPQYVIDRMWLENMSKHDRPLNFKCKNIIDAQHKRLLDESQKPLVETYVHLSDCTDSVLFPQPTVKTKMDMKESHWSDFDVERMTHAFKSWSDPGKFPAIKGKQYVYPFEGL